MGNFYSTAPKEGEGHPALFYKGVQAASEARYTVSELYFINALRKHPAREFWNTLMGAATVKMNKSVERTTSVDEDGVEIREWADVEDRHAYAEGEEGGHKGAMEEEDSLAQKESTWRTDNVSTSCGARQREKKRMYDDTAIDLHLPMDSRLKSVLGYFRLLADIAVTYLNQLPTTRHKEKVRDLAARYCLFTISHTQIFLHSLTLWKEEKVGDGGGFIDYDRKRHLQKVAALLDAEESGEAESEREVDAQEISPRASKKPILYMTLALAEAECRYYFLTFLINYTFILVDEYKEMPEHKRQSRVYGNIMEHLDTAFELLWTVAREYPDEYIGHLIMKSVPPPCAVGERDPYSLAGASLRASCAKTLNLSDDQHRHLYATAAPWSPLHCALQPLLVARGVRLCPQGSVYLSALVRLQSPAQRMCYPYLYWHSKALVVGAPGCHPYLLSKALPGFKLGKSVLSYQTKMVMQDSPVGGMDMQGDTGYGNAAAKAFSGAGVPPGATNTSGDAAAQRSAEQFVMLKKYEKEMRKHCKQMSGELDLKDGRTCVVLCQHEVVLVGLLAFLLSIEVRILAGQRTAADVYVHAVRELVSGLCGPFSPEMGMLSFLLTTVGW